MHTLRPYQESAYSAVIDFWAKGGENPLVEMATGTGKSLVSAVLDQRLVEQYSDLRILNLTHVRELIEQNYKELVSLWPWAPAGIYSAGMGRRELHAQIVFGGIQSIYTKAKQLGHVDIVKIDEAHLISSNSESMYGKLLGDLTAINPELRCVGLTATPYRTDTGRLDEGDVRLFDEIVFTYSIADGIKDGYLAPLVSKATATGFDLGGVGRRGGDYIAGALQAACDKDATTMAAVTEIVAMGENRRSWLAFCAGVEHAHHVAAEIKRRGITCGVITGDTPKGERDRLIEDHKAGRIRCLTNNSVLTTGYNNPMVDLMAMLRPTLSPGLYVQMAGRGTRTAPDKTNCLVLDFAGNVKKHGPVDAVEPRAPGKGDGEAPVKECPNCHSLIHLSLMECPDCGYNFPKEEKPKHEAKASTAPILATGAPEWLPVLTRGFRLHQKEGGKDTVRVEFFANYTTYRSWLCPGHTGYAKTKSDQFWKQHGGEMPAPSSVEEFLDRVDELQDTAQIQVRPSGRYWEVVGMKAGEITGGNLAGVGSKPKYSTLDDEIPF